MISKFFSNLLSKPVRLVGVLILAAIFVSSCQPVIGLPVSPAATTPASKPVTVTDVSINVASNSELGSFLVGDNGMTLYMFTKDGPGKSNCDADCLKKWPPLITQGNPTLGEGVDAALIGTATLPDGAKIVTYNNMPLYYWYKDHKAGDTDGQGVGDVWYVVSPDGKVIDQDKADEAVVPTATVPAAEVTEPTINVASKTELGSFLVGDNGMTLYMFTKDEPGKSNCDAECLKKWPPLLTQGSPKPGEGVDAALIGTATLPDGSKIVTYNKMPLYYWVKDTKAGDTTGQGVGEVWYVVSPDGQVIKQATAADAVVPAAFVEPTISIANDPVLGPILVGDNGMTLYMFTKDGPGKSNCDAECLKKWPPLLTQGSPKPGEGVDASLIGVATLPDGTMIVTYNGMPLYYWFKDTQAGDTTGQGVGEVWFVVSPAGNAVKAPTSSASPDSSPNMNTNDNSDDDNGADY